MVIGPRTLAALLTATTLATVILIWLIWFAFSRGVFGRPKCPRCASERIRHSVTSHWQDHIVKLFLALPYRCEGCGLRHYNARWVRTGRDDRNPKRVVTATE